MIDLVLSNMPQNVCKTTALQSCLSDHEMISTIRKINSVKVKPRTIICRNYKNYNKASTKSIERPMGTCL